ncbi:MAG: hypothetical protein E7054_06720 [Lentisphaerae bacterium]|nr:hypothetical protein [Lentisphaerota bacterium]
MENQTYSLSPVSAFSASAFSASAFPVSAFSASASPAFLSPSGCDSGISFLHFGHFMDLGAAGFLFSSFLVSSADSFLPLSFFFFLSFFLFFLFFLLFFFFLFAFASFFNSRSRSTFLPHPGHLSSVSVFSFFSCSGAE